MPHFNIIPCTHNNLATAFIEARDDSEKGVVNLFRDKCLDCGKVVSEHATTYVNGRPVPFGTPTRFT